jgi:ABC-type multidrug transport system ATPase subunit
MSETVLDALVKLFALIGDIHDETVLTSRGKNIVRTFLARHLNNELVARYMKMFEEYLTLYNSENITKGTIADRKRISLNSMRILAICEKINEELQQKQKIYVLVQLLDFISLGEEITETELDFIQTVSTAFYIPETEFHNIRSFVMDSVNNVGEKNKILVIDNKKTSAQSEIKHLFNENLKGSILFLNITSTNSYILRYSGAEDLYLNGQIVSPGQTYIFDHGSSIRGPGIKTVFYSEVVSQITEAAYDFKICLDANDVSFNFRNSENGIHNLNFHEESGKLVGILGASGVGKSTTLSILNGTLKPQSGEILINGYNLYDENEKESLKGIIGFVPQDDLLIEELTVYQNLYYNAKMCLNNLTEDNIIESVNKTLIDLDLYEVRDLKVGNPLKKIISGGQRKRVNIALELIREPRILFVDEPTSGLSSVDSEIVMNLLKEQTYKGKLVIINIHQPGSEIYKMFDKVMIIDKGGYEIYYGNPTEAIIYFKTITNHGNPEEDQCVKCGNVNTDQILQIIEAKVIDEHGKATRIRKVTPEEWAEKFREHSAGTVIGIRRDKSNLPGSNYSIPGIFKQSKIFFIRDLLSKLADKQYILISLLGPPLLAFLLAYFTKSGNGGTYSFSENENLPAYMFMCVITSLFFGLMISSEEIVKDRKILKRESFLNLSWFSYLNSKIMILFILSGIQTISFILIGNQILEIKGMNLSYWLVLFTTSCFANLVGLNISSAFNSVVTIYILIPFIIIPQLLFSGVLVKFDKLHIAGSSSREYVPVIGDLMTARWAFEAVAVRQFKDNEFEKNYFKNDIAESQNSYYGSCLINSGLKKDLMICINYKDSSNYSDEVNESFRRLNYHIPLLAELSKIEPGEWKDSLTAKKFNPVVEKRTSAFLDSSKKYFYSQQKLATSLNNAIGASLKTEMGEGKMIDLENNYENKKLKELILDELNPERIHKTPEKFVQKYNPGFMKATSRIGRAHFYAPFKKIGNREIDTFLFNLLVLWLVTLFLYVILYFKLIQKTITFFGTMRFARSEKKE